LQVPSTTARGTPPSRAQQQRLEPNDAMRCDLTRFGQQDIDRCTTAVEHAVAAATSVESAATAMCRLLAADLAGADEAPACVMVRAYVTHPYGGLPPDLQRWAKRAFGAVAITPPEPGMRCLVLLATVGDEPEWNDRRQSRGHQAIPLPSPHVVERAPMIARLMREFGLDLARMARPATRIASAPGETEGVFHVEEAAGSPFIPAQEGFVDRYGIHSVLGFGGLLPSGELFCIILFTRVHVPAGTAERFRELAIAIGRSLGARALPVFEPMSA
jgi:hypothetical protein